MPKNDTILKYTEAAISLLGGIVPGIVYMPPDIRASKARISADGLVTEAPYGDGEIVKRIAAADPLGLLLAIMNGQPIPGFRVVQKGQKAPQLNKGGRPTHKHSPTLPEANAKLATLEDGTDIYVEYYSPTLGHRERVAQYLLGNIMPIKKAAGSAKGKKSSAEPDDYKAMVERRAREQSGGD